MLSKKTLHIVFLVLISFSSLAREEKLITKPVEVPHEPFLGFTLNLAGVAAMTAEGRFIWGPNGYISLVASPMYQNTADLPIYDFESDKLKMRSIRRLNLGLGLRGHFYEYDSRDGWYVEAMGRFGGTWVGEDKGLLSLIPSVMGGYTAIYDSGYTVSCGAGLEYEFLLGNKNNFGKDAQFLRKAYFGLSKLPIVMEFSVGWIF